MTRYFKLKNTLMADHQIPSNVKNKVFWRKNYACRIVLHSAHLRVSIHLNSQVWILRSKLYFSWYLFRFCSPNPMHQITLTEAASLLCRGTARVSSQKGWRLPLSRPWVPGLSISPEETEDLSIEVRSLLETRGEAKYRGGKRKMRSSKQWLWELRMPFSVRVRALNVSGIGCRIWGPREMSES